MKESFEEMLTGGHPNSLGNTVQVVDIVLANKERLEELYQCYFSKDEVVRLRVSSAMKRVCKEHPEWLVPYLDKLLDEISTINQASTQWTLAILFLWLERDMTPSQHERATKIMQTNLENSNDWIVQNTTMESLAAWAKEDDRLQKWLIPKLHNFTKSTRKSVAGRARKLLIQLKVDSD